MVRFAGMVAAALALAACAEVQAPVNVYVTCDRCTVFPGGSDQPGIVGSLIQRFLVPRDEKPVPPVLPRLPQREEP